MKKKIVVVILLALMILVPTQAFADENSALGEPGIKPDSMFYLFDRAGEWIVLVFNADLVKEAQLLNEIAGERVSEGSVMVDEGQIALAEKAMLDYEESLNKALDSVDKAIQEGQDVTGVVQTLNDTGIDTEGVIVEIVSVFPEESKTTLKEKITKSNQRLAAVNIVLTELIEDEALLNQAKELGLSTKEIVAAKSLAEQSGKPIAEVMNLLAENNKDLGATALALGLTVKEAMAEIKDSYKETKKEIKKLFKEIKEEEKEAKKEAKEEDKEAKKKLIEAEKKAKEEQKEAEKQAREKQKEAEKELKEAEKEAKEKQQEKKTDSEEDEDLNHDHYKDADDDDQNKAKDKDEDQDTEDHDED